MHHYWERLLGLKGYHQLPIFSSYFNVLCSKDANVIYQVSLNKNLRIRYIVLRFNDTKVGDQTYNKKLQLDRVRYNACEYQ